MICAVGMSRICRDVGKLVFYTVGKSRLCLKNNDVRNREVTTLSKKCEFARWGGHAFVGKW